MLMAINSLISLVVALTEPLEPLVSAYTSLKWHYIIEKMLIYSILLNDEDVLKVPLNSSTLKSVIFLPLTLLSLGKI